MNCKYESTERPFLYFMVLIILMNTCGGNGNSTLKKELDDVNKKLDVVTIKLDSLSKK